MPYVRRTWQNAPSSATPLNAAALNNIEDGVEVAYEAVTDRLSEANLESTIGVVVDEGIDALDIPALVDAGIQDSPTVIAAVGAAASASAVGAVADEIEARDLVESAGWDHPISDHASGFTDENGLPLLTFKSDGTIHPDVFDRNSDALVDVVGPPVLAETGVTNTATFDTAGGFIDADGREVFGFRADGSLTTFTRDMLRGSVLYPRFPLSSIAMFTDSMGTGIGPGLATALGVDVYAGGVRGSQNSEQIAARAGGFRARFTISGGEVPASGPATVTSFTVNPVLSAGNFDLPGFIAGVPVIAKYNGTTLTVERAIAGAAVPAAGAVEFTATEEAYTDRTLLLIMGTNDPGVLTPEQACANIQSVIDAQRAQIKRVLVFQPWPNAAWVIGNGTRPAYDAVRGAIETTFRSYLVPYFDYFRTDAAFTATGITKTADDTTDITNGIIPRSFRDDAIHANTTVKNYLASTYIPTILRDRNWYV